MMNKRGIITIIIFTLLLFAGFIALTQELDVKLPGHGEEEGKISEGGKGELSDENKALAETAYEKPAQWFISNAGGMPLIETQSRFTALRNEYALAVEFAVHDDLPDRLLPYNDKKFSPEIRFLYRNKKLLRTQWILRDEKGTTRVNAVFVEAAEDQGTDSNEQRTDNSGQIADNKDAESSVQKTEISEQTEDSEQEAESGEEIADNGVQAQVSGEQAADKTAGRRERRVSRREQRTQTSGSENNVQLTDNSEQAAGVADNAELTAEDSEQTADNADLAAEDSEQTADNDELAADSGKEEEGKQEKTREAAVNVSKISGFIEIFNENAFLKTEINYYEDGGRIKIDYEANKNLIIKAVVSSWQTDKKKYIVSFTDFYRYNRSLSLRAVERVFSEDIEMIDEPLRITFPRRIMDALKESQISSQRLNMYPEFFGDIFNFAASRMIYESDERGRIISQTLLDDKDYVIWIIKSAWRGDRIISTSKIEGQTELRADYEYAANGDIRSERNYRNGNLERVVRINNKTEIEELYYNNILVLQAVWEDGRKISETRVR